VEKVVDVFCAALVFRWRSPVLEACRCSVELFFSTLSFFLLSTSFRTNPLPVLLFRVAHMIHFVLLISRQGKMRMNKFYSPYTQKEKAKIQREVVNLVLSRAPKLCNFIEWKDMKVIYKRYASLYFVMCVDPTDNELIVLETIHHYVEVLDRYFGNVCELDLIFNFHKAYFMLDEMLMAGELQETSKKNVLRILAQQDIMHETTGQDVKIEL